MPSTADTPPATGSAAAPDGGVTFALQDDGTTRADVWADGRSVSHQVLKPYTLCFGAARVSATGIGKVETAPEERRRGHYRRLMAATLEHLAREGRELAVLYGIAGFYPKFGFATAGPEHFLELTKLDERPPLPAGWTVRPFAEGDLAAVRRIYDDATAWSTGAALRGARDWARMPGGTHASAEDACRVAVSPRGEVAGYAWRSQGPWGWAVRHLQRRYPDAWVVGEALATHLDAGDAILWACRDWGAMRIGGDAPCRRVIVATEPSGAVARAAMHHHATFARHYAACGESMARVVRVRPLMEALAPELSRTLRASERAASAGTLRMTTDIGAVDLALADGEVRVVDADAGAAAPTWHLEAPQHEIARLCFGAFPPEHVLARLASPPSAETSRVVAALFPLRQPHMHAPDRF